jgi:CRISPR-associated protein Csd1
LSLPADYNAGANVTFVVDGVFVVDLPAVQEFWAAENAPGDTVMQCIVCGQQRRVLPSLQTPIKGAPGGQASGTAIISANKDAFESYGLERSLIAPTCASCAESFTRGINDLLANRQHSIITGGAALVFWTKDDNPFSLRDWLDTPHPEQVRALIEAVRSGKPLPQVDATAFYAAILSGSGGRTVVRDWIDATVAEVKQRLAYWFAGQSVVGPWGEEPKSWGVFALAAATVRDASKDLGPVTPRALWRAALAATPVPSSLLWQAVQRNRAEGKVTAQRAALIKLVLCSNELDEAARRIMEEKMTQLNLDNPNPAYLCGRLLAVLEEAQAAALPGIKAGIVDRFYGTASSAPASVFGRLLRGAQAHLGKLQRDRPSAYRAIQRRLEEAQSGLTAFPRTLTLEEQGLFALGYYHQRAYDRAQAKDAAERRKAEAAATDEDGDNNENEMEETR